MALLFFTDTETTGLPDFRKPVSDPSQPNICEIAALLYNTDDDRIEAQFCAIIKPEGWSIPEHVAKIHGISQERAEKYGMPESDVLLAVGRMLEISEGFVAYNESFDHFLLQVMWGRVVGDPKVFPQKPRECVMKMCVPICKIPPTDAMMASGRTGYKSPKLGEAYKHFFGKELKGAHSAMTDVRATLRIYRKLTHKSREGQQNE